MVVIKEVAASSSWSWCIKCYGRYILVEVIINIIIYKVLVDTSLKSFSCFVTFFFSVLSWLIVSFLTHKARPSIIVAVTVI